MPCATRPLQLEAQRRWTLKRRNEFPWELHYYHARQRCTNIGRNDYKFYGAKGIKFLLTKDEVKELWFRDKAYLLTKPSIDRLDDKGHYEFSNCQFIELRDNIIKRF